MLFYVDETPVSKNYLIRANIQELPIHQILGSLNVLQARICGLPYDEYLRMCRDEYGAEIIGKASMFPTPYFKDKAKATKLAKLLSERAQFLLSKQSENSNSMPEEK